MLSPQKKEELIKAVKEYGEAEVIFGKAITDYCGLSGSLEETTREVGEKFRRVIDLVHKL